MPPKAKRPASSTAKSTAATSSNKAKASSASPAATSATSTISTISATSVHTPKSAFNGPLGSDPEQAILNVIRHAFASIIQQPQFEERRMAIKKAFVDRNYDSIFTDPQNLPVYSAKYAPSRALGFFTLLRNTDIISLALKEAEGRVLGLGAGAGSELVAFAALAAVSSPASVQCELVDFGEYGDILKLLDDSVRYKWHLDTSQFTMNFHQCDILNESNAPLLAQLIASTNFITAFFVLNELFVDKKRTMQVITLLVKNMKPGCHLLIVDSAGSFSNLEVGGRTYPVYTMFDAMKTHFELVGGSESQWYRYPAHLQYPLDLENMRYFYRLYKKL